MKERKEKKQWLQTGSINWINVHQRRLERFPCDKANLLLLTSWWLQLLFPICFSAWFTWKDLETSGMRRARRAVPHQSLIQVYWEPLTCVCTCIGNNTKGGVGVCCCFWHAKSCLSEAAAPTWQLKLYILSNGNGCHARQIKTIMWVVSISICDRTLW